MLGSIYPLLYQSLAWFRSMRGVLRRETIGSKIRSSDLEIGLSFSVGPVGAGTDTTAFIPSLVPSSSHPSASNTSRLFHALKEECSLKRDTFRRFRDMFQFLDEIRVCLPRKCEKSCAFAHGEVCFYKAVFLCGLRFPVHPFIMELLHYLNIALG